MEQSMIVNVQDYYQNLTKIEKSKLLGYMMVKYGYCYTTIRAKIAGGGRGRLRKNEEKDVLEAIENESVWRR